MFTADLKSDKGQALLHRHLAKTDVLLTSFRPSALRKLGWRGRICASATRSYRWWKSSAPGERAEEPGHDLTYMAEAGLVTGTDMPASLYADMGGSLMASEAVLQSPRAAAHQRQGRAIEIALSEAARYLALPRSWGLTVPSAAVGGGHAGYRVYPARMGVGLAALEPHFAASLAQEVGLTKSHIMAMFAPESHTAVARWCATQSCQQLETIGAAKDIPFHAASPGAWALVTPSDLGCHDKRRCQAHNVRWSARLRRHSAPRRGGWHVRLFQKRPSESDRARPARSAAPRRKPAPVMGPARQAA